MSDIVPVTVSPFETLGSEWRFGTAPDSERVFVVIADVAKDLGHRDAANAARMIDPEEKGTQRVSTPGGEQNMLVAYEDGLWELIFLSRVPGAKAIKKRVKEILAALNRGETVGPEGPQKSPAEMAAELTRRDLALMIVAEADRADAEAARAVVAEQRIAELEPKAAAADALAEADGTLSMGAVANMFGVGRTTFFKLLRTERIIQGDRRPYQDYAAWFRVATGTYESSDGAKHVHYTSHLYPAGALRLHALLAKRGHVLRKPVIDGQLSLISGGAA